MMHSLIKIAAPLILIIIFFACKKNDHLQSTLPGQGTGSVTGIITDVNNAPVSNATVTGGTATATTDGSGKFTLAKVQFTTDTVLVNVTKDGFFGGSKKFASSTNAVTDATIQLIPKVSSGTVTASSGGNVPVSGGGSVNLSSGFVTASNGNAYTGNVSVSTSYLNPTDQNFNAHAPGNIKVASNANKQGTLQSFGMIAVEMNDASGNKLQIATGKTATITIPIPSALQSIAPSSIPLWYFDDTKGSWTQEGSATKQGSNYIGTVKHFSFWNAGDLVGSVKLTATFIDSVSGKALTNRMVTITRLGAGLDTTSTSATTDSSGTVSGFVPVNESLNMKVLNSCGIVLYSKNIGPFSMDTNLDTTTVNNIASSSITLSGTVVNCSNMAVTNGYVQVTIGSNQFKSAIANGSFSITFSRCNNLVSADSIVAYDTANKQQSIPRSIDTVRVSQNIGKITACILPAPPVAAFNYSGSGTALPITVTFSDASTNATSYLWDFGDGGTSTIQNPSHVFTTAGDYTVKLTATGNGGTNSITAIIHIANRGNTNDSEYINLTLNGLNYSWALPDSVSAQRVDSGGVFNTIVLGSSGDTSTKSIFFVIVNDKASPGNYTFNNGSVNISSVQYSLSYTTTTVTEYGIVGGYITGTASGSNFTCSYRVRRIQ